MKVEQLSLADYNKIKNIPVVNQDLSSSGFTPVANTYYRHTGTTGTYKQGVIYYYDGTEYKALDGSGGGGISDVKVNGTSVVTDGVANIPKANDQTSGVITNDFQIFDGIKSFKKSVGLLQYKTGTNYPLHLFNSAIDSSKATLNTAASNKSVEMKYYLYGYGSTLSGAVSPFDYVLIQPHQNEAILYYSTSAGTSVAMFAPQSWSSGTSGSVTLSQSGTYQIYMNDGNHNINFGVVYWDGSTATCGQMAMVSSTTGYYLSISDAGVMTVYNEDFNGHTSTSTTDTIYYRKIGI